MATAPPDAPSASVAAPPSVQTAAVFSAPIAAARQARGNVVAGLVAADGVVRVSRIAEDGSNDWTVDALRGVSWEPDVDLRLFPADEGAALVWRGQLDGSTSRSLFVIPSEGREPEGPVDIGSSFCATRDGIAWLEPHPGAPTRVRARGWSSGAIGDVVGLAPDRDASLVCGDHAVLVLGDGDDDLTATSFVPGDPTAQTPAVALRRADFGDDDEREHDAYSLGDDLGLVWVGASGSLWIRELPRGAPATRWRCLKHAIGEDDDVVAVDGDADRTYVVYTHDADEACPDPASTPASVRVVVADRKSGTDSRFELAPPSCDRTAGPFWVAPAPGGTVVAWIERANEPDSHAPPIVGVALRTIAGGAVHPSRIDLAADAAVDAGCDDRACYLAVLVRPPDSDGMSPEAVRLIPYP
jgi:hypothetical protein